MSTAAPLACREVVTLVTEYLEGRLSPSDRARFEAHIGGCPHCTAYLEQMRDAIRMTGTLAEDQLPREVLDALLEALRGWDQRPGGG
jgi:anti-sigma factor RsiW